MPLYMVQGTYTAEALATMAKNPQDRSIPYFCFGEYDIVVIGELPDDSTATAFALAAMSPGHLKTYRTTKLFTAEETMEAMRKASSLSFQGPSRG